MNAKEFSLGAMSAEELIALVNDNIDTTMFPLGEICSTGDIDQWEEIGDELGGYGLMTLLTKYPMPERAYWFQYDSDTNQLYWYRNRRDIINVVGEDTLKEWYECSLD